MRNNNPFLADKNGALATNLTRTEVSGIITRNVRYLKCVGEHMDTKITYRTVYGTPVLYIRDLEFFSFEEARRYLQLLAETETMEAQL